MNSMKFMIAAYVATWVIHGGYLATLVSRYSKLRREMKELGSHHRG
jgi:CcmD family protein